MPATVSITIANRQEWEKTLADYARACHKTLEYSALRGARNWTIRGARKFRAFQEDSPAIVLSDGSRRSSQIISYRLRKKAEAGRGLDIRREDGRRVIVTTKGRKRVREVRYVMPRGAYFSREYAREYATRQYRAMMGHRGFVRVLPWRVCAALDQRLAALAEFLVLAVEYLILAELAIQASVLQGDTGTGLQAYLVEAFIPIGQDPGCIAREGMLQSLAYHGIQPQQVVGRDAFAVRRVGNDD